MARKVSGLSRNRPQVTSEVISTWLIQAEMTEKKITTPLLQTGNNCSIRASKTARRQMAWTKSLRSFSRIAPTRCTPTWLGACLRKTSWCLCSCFVAR
ncbi:unnamed protein product [Porites lobata]|uniref:Uncharacterized protein n=1 Tax=Porites lobata TaxID=104759 RepID=A0ABN8RX01_9CNID|nr:unnamed protein product [Porites lobata]